MIFHDLVTKEMIGEGNLENDLYFLIAISLFSIVEKMKN
jgi:hypothetical protein